MEKQNKTHKSTEPLSVIDKPNKTHKPTEPLSVIDFDWVNDGFDTNVTPDQQPEKVDKPKQSDTIDDKPRKRKRNVQPVQPVRKSNRLKK